MNLREIIVQLIRIAIFFAFPTIWNWIVTYIPWWPLDPESTMNILVFVLVTAISWIFGAVGIRTFVNSLKQRGLAAEVTAR